MWEVFHTIHKEPVENSNSTAQTPDKMRFFDMWIVEKPVENVEKHKLFPTIRFLQCAKTSHWDFAQKKKTGCFSDGTGQKFTVLHRRSSSALDTDSGK